jgi:hypothetical protein
MFLIPALISLILGLIFLAIAFTQISQNTSVLDTIVGPKMTLSETHYGVSANYYLNGNSKGTISGTLQSSQCCVDFYIFNNTEWNSWDANNFTITNSSNSPVLSVDSKSIDSTNGAPTAFSLSLNPSATYIMVFFNTNRSLWNGNSTATYKIKTDISINYQAYPGKFLAYPGVGLIALGAILIFLRERFLR